MPGMRCRQYDFFFVENSLVNHLEILELGNESTLNFGIGILGSLFG
jgi:hypothetical protein